ncbi:MAG: DUF2236 domain-containing protein [Gemmatimonadetes bacterium]|nr:DUF2236 domain-containing protein [Gemmatimonadota bacterium]MYE68957.1 DUF2236 domain-containing protein [Gemmatimonadota bacterium]MYJ69490.1 DUF2236 domain-containing protein [Gemmatimonadota bacterium]
MAITIPSAYADGYETARLMEPELAEAYIRHTQIGDPLADAVAADLVHLPSKQVHALLAKVLEDPENLPADAPESLRRFMVEVRVVPEWFDEEVARVASRAFLRNSDLVLAALVGGSIVEGFATLISKSFRIRGRVMASGVRRLKQNGLQLIEQYLPGGMSPLGDGWKLTIRVRLVHAQSRMFIGQSDEWNRERYGLPISAATVLLAGAAFSGRLMQHVATLGGDFSAEEREAYVHVWRYTGLLIGIPPEVLFEDEASAVRTFELGRLCEPPPDEDAIIMANSIVNSAPLVVGINEVEERRKLSRYVYRVSRELIGDSLADAFLFPTHKRQVLPFFRMRGRTKRFLGRAVPSLCQKQDLERFKGLIDFVNLGRLEHSYSLPTALHDEHSSEW